MTTIQYFSRLGKICGDQKKQGNYLRKSIFRLNCGIYFLILQNMFGCAPQGLNQREDNLEFELYHDFGPIQKDEKSLIVSHEFSIRNDSDQIMKLVDQRSSCSCVVFQAGNDDKVVLDVPPHSRILVSAGVSLQSKIGPFVENIILHYDGVKPAMYLLNLQGLVLTSPMPVVDKIRFVSLTDGTVNRECLCSHQRRKEQKPVKLLESSVHYDSDVVPDFTFDVKDAIFNTVNGGQSTVIETWKFPIGLISHSKNATGKAMLKFAWSDGSSSAVQLIVESGREIEVLQSRVLLETNLGNSLTTYIPARFATNLTTEAFEVCSDAAWCRATLNIQKQAIEVRVDGSRLGVHKCKLSLRESGVEVCGVEVECFVK